MIVRYSRTQQMIQYIIFHIKEVQSTIVLLDYDEEEDDEMRNSLRAIELSQREEHQRALKILFVYYSYQILSYINVNDINVQISISVIKPGKIYNNALNI